MLKRLSARLALWTRKGDRPPTQAAAARIGQAASRSTTSRRKATFSPALPSSEIWPRHFSAREVIWQIDSLPRFEPDRAPAAIDAESSPPHSTSQDQEAGTVASMIDISICGSTTTPNQ